MARLYRLHPQIYVCSDSDEMGVCSLAVEPHKELDEQYALRPRRVGVLAEFAEGHAGLLHRELFRHPIRLKIRDIQEEKWRSVEQQADKVVQEIEGRLAIPDGILALEHPAAYQARMQRQANLHHMSPYSMELFDRVAEVDRSRGSAAGRATLALGRGFVLVLHATRISRAFRLYLLPKLGWRQRLWIHALLKALGINAPLIKSRPERDNRRWGWIRWLFSWMRILPEKKRPYTTN